MEEDARVVQPSAHVKKLNERAHALLEANTNFISNASFLQSIAALKAAQLPNSQDGTPAQSAIEVSILQKRCVDLLDDLNKVQKKTRASDGVSSDSRRELLVEKRRQLQAEIDVLKDGFLYHSEQHSDPIVLERIKQELIDGIPRLDVTHTEMTAELKAHMDTLARSKQMAAELEELNVALQKRVETLKKEKQTRGAGTASLEAEAADLATKNGKLMRLLADFLAKHYPPPPPRQAEKKRKKDSQEESQSQGADQALEYHKLQDLIQSLLSQTYRHDSDPYVRITERFYPPYVELLIRAGIAEKHPGDSMRLRLTQFHK